MPCKLFLLLLLSSSFILCHAKDDPCLDFGKNIKVYTDLEKLFGKEGKRAQSSLDLNGDGVKDRVALLAISNDSKIKPNVIASNPFTLSQYNDDQFYELPYLAIGIIHSATKTTRCKRFIIYNNLIFSEWNGTIDNFYINDNPLIKIVRCEFGNDGKYDQFCFEMIGGEPYSLYYDDYSRYIKEEGYQVQHQVFEDPL